MMFTFFTATSGNKSIKQTPVTENHIWLICDKVATDWRDLGTVLGTTSALMDIIETDCSASHEKARKVLLKWKQRKGKGATVGILINALKEIERIDVVEKLLGM